MGLFRPTLPSSDPLRWVEQPFPERARQVCEAWAMEGYGTPLGVFALHALKVGLYIGGWLLFCSMSPSLGSPTELATFWLRPLAFEKASVWSLLFEVLGLGCGSGPLTGRYLPPVGGFLYFLRPVDASTGVIERGALAVSELRARPPWIAHAPATGPRP